MKAFLFLAIVGFTGRGFAVPLACEERPPSHAWEAGLTLHVLMPNNLPDFATSVSAYGALGSLPLGEGAMQAEIQYGSAAFFYLTLIEMNYVLPIRTPFFTPLLMAGVHYLHYSAQSNAHTMLGVNTGVGLLFPLAQDFQITLTLKGYLEAHSILSFGGGFAILL